MIIIVRSIMKSYENVFRYTIFQITYDICSTPLYSFIWWQPFLILLYFLSLKYLFSNFSLWIKQIFAFSYDSCCSFVNNFIFFLFKVNFLHCVLSYGFTNLFHATFLSMYIMLIFYVFRWRYCRHEKTSWNMLADFCCRWIFRIIFTSITFFYYRFKSCINNKWCFIRSLILIKFLYILVPSEGIITLYKL